MKVSNFKLYTMIGAAIMGLGLAPATLRAAPDANITATLTSVGALSATLVAGMNFGTWYLDAIGDPITLVKATTGTTVETATGGSIAEVVGVANTTPAQVTVQITGGGAGQDGTVIQVTRDAINQFGDLDAVLSDITYRTITQVGENPLAEATPENVTITAGASAEPVYFGGTITVSGNVNSGPNTADFDVEFSY